MDLENVYIYRFSNKSKFSSLNFLFRTRWQLVVPRMKPNATRVLLAVALAAVAVGKNPVFCNTTELLADVLWRAISTGEFCARSKFSPAAVASAWNVVQTTLTPAAKLVDRKKCKNFAET